MWHTYFCDMKLSLIFILFFQISFAQNIIPLPVSCTLNEKETCNTLQFATVATTIDARIAKPEEIRFVFPTIKKFIQISYPVRGVLEKKDSTIVLDRIMVNDTFQRGYYEIDIRKNNIYISANSPAGFFYAFKTLEQLDFNYQHKIPTGKITDYPRYAWRGMHLDCCRHFFSKEFIKKYIDILALHKMNVFHWHLTDDQGWRIEIKKYPLLTSIGSKRKETMIEKNFNPYKGDGKEYGGFYTQEDIKEIIKYAQERFITIVPEIEMPGHALAALSAYPQYSCNKKPLEALTKWGVSDDVFCVNDSTFHFLFDVLQEVMTLFPSKYIHIGGDEVPKTRWKNCAQCQSVIHQNKLKDEHELQSFFVKKIDSFVSSKGKNIIGWDEILEGGVSSTAAIMSWRGTKGGIEASNKTKSCYGQRSLSGSHY
jgi:hexosaminidase